MQMFFILTIIISWWLKLVIFTSSPVPPSRKLLTTIATAVFMNKYQYMEKEFLNNSEAIVILLWLGWSGLPALPLFCLHSVVVVLNAKRQ